VAPKKFNFLNIWPFGNQIDCFSKEPNSGSNPALVFRTRIETRIGIYFFLGRTKLETKFLVLFMCETRTKDSYNLFSRNQSSGGPSS
jgi:hypothetical protein